MLLLGALGLSPHFLARQYLEYGIRRREVSDGDAE